MCGRDCHECSDEKIAAYVRELFDGYAGRLGGSMVVTQSAMTTGACQRMKDALFKERVRRGWLTKWEMDHHGGKIERVRNEMTKELQVFSFEESQTRVRVIKGALWLVAKDVAGALGYSGNSSVAQLMQSVPDEWKGIKRIDTLGGEQKMLCLSEQGLYFFLGRSDKPKALPYQKWIAGEVVPTIRKAGEYSTPEAQRRKADKKDELALRRVEVMEKNADYRMAKLILAGIDKFSEVMTPESKTVFMAKYAELTTKQDLTHMLPQATEPMYSATDIGKECGVSAQMIGKVANEYKLKSSQGESGRYGTWIRSKSPYSEKEVMTFVYNADGRDWFLRHFGTMATA